MSSFGHQTTCELLGLTGNGDSTWHRDLLLAELARASDKRAHVIALVMVLGASEHGIRDIYTWQSAEDSYWASCGIPLAARYLAWLAEHTDYALSDIEAEVASRATGGSASGAREPTSEAGNWAAQPDDDGDQVTGPGDSEGVPERDTADQEQTQAPTETG
jgi:hypothetical protein